MSNKHHLMESVIGDSALVLMVIIILLGFHILPIIVVVVAIPLCPLSTRGGV